MAGAVIFLAILRELTVEESFNIFKASEIARLPCSYCGKHCSTSINISNGCDVYGQKIDNHDGNGHLVDCSVCKKNVAAVKFASHLEKCMGLGRVRSKRTTKKDKNNKLSNASSASDLEEQYGFGALGCDGLPSILPDDPYTSQKSIPSTFGFYNGSLEKRKKSGLASDLGLE